MNDLLSRKRLFQAGKANTSHLQLHQFSGARTENDKGRDAEFPRAIGRIAAGAGGAKKNSRSRIADCLTRWTDLYSIKRFAPDRERPLGASLLPGRTVEAQRARPFPVRPARTKNARKQAKDGF